MGHRPRYSATGRLDRNEPFDYNTVIDEKRGAIFFARPEIQQYQSRLLFIGFGRHCCVVVAFFRVAANVPVDNKQIEILHVKPFNIICSFVRGGRESFFLFMSIRPSTTVVNKSFSSSKSYIVAKRNDYTPEKKKTKKKTIVVYHYNRIGRIAL